MKTCPEALGAAEGWGGGFHWSSQALLEGLSFLTQSVGRFFPEQLNNIWKISPTCEDFPDLLSKTFGRFHWAVRTFLTYSQQCLEKNSDLWCLSNISVEYAASMTISTGQWNLKNTLETRSGEKFHLFFKHFKVKVIEGPKDWVKNGFYFESTRDNISQEQTKKVS